MLIIILVAEEASEESQVRQSNGNDSFRTDHAMCLRKCTTNFPCSTKEEEEEEEDQQGRH